MLRKGLEHKRVLHVQHNIYFTPLQRLSITDMAFPVRLYMYGLSNGMVSCARPVILIDLDHGGPEIEVADRANFIY